MPGGFARLSVLLSCIDVSAVLKVNISGYFLDFESDGHKA